MYVPVIGPFDILSFPLVAFDFDIVIEPQLVWCETSDIRAERYCRKHTQKIFIDSIRDPYDGEYWMF